MFNSRTAKNAVLKYIVMAHAHAKGLRILDYGAGPTAPSSKFLRQRGYHNVVAYDLPLNMRAGIHDSNAMNHALHYEVVFASNVLNVQRTPNEIENMLKEIYGVLRPGGIFIFNYAAEPHLLPLEDVKEDTRLMLLQSISRDRGLDWDIKDITKERPGYSGSIYLARKAPSQAGCIDVAPKSSVMKTLKGSKIERYLGLVGKQMYGTVYVHKDYASRIMPASVLDRAFKEVTKAYPGFKYNVVEWDSHHDPKTLGKGNRGYDIVRFSESPDFNTAREPHVGELWQVQLLIQEDGSVVPTSVQHSHSNAIWHHKWLWVMDDYKGFDVQASKEWSAKWLSKFKEPAKGTDRTFQVQLKKYGVI